MIMESLDSLTLEFTLREMQMGAAMLPASHVPVRWLRELVVEARPTLGAYPLVLDKLVQTLFSQGTLQSIQETPELARADERSTRLLRDSTEEAERAAIKGRLRALATRRLHEAQAEQTHRINRVMTGDPLLEVTAWTVPPLAEVQARAAVDDRVQIIEYGDGTYSVRAEAMPAWETEAIKALVVQEFTSDDLDSIEWALRTRLLSSDELRQAEHRVGELHLCKPYIGRKAFVAGLFWLMLAHKWYGEGGSARASWNLSGKAVNILGELRDHQPDDPAVGQLLAEAERACWSYDD